MGFATPSAWITAMRRLPGIEYDNVLLGTGHEGAGKSLLLIKILKALDPSFSPDRIWFLWEDFQACCEDLKPGQAALWDEVRLSKFRQGSTQSEEFRNFVQEKRGLRLHLGLALPHWEILDPNLIPLRVRWNVHVERRGIYVLRKPIRRRDHDGYEGMEWHWHSLNRWPTTMPTGPLVEEYRRRKKLHMMGRTVRYKDVAWDRPESVVRDVGYELAGFDARAADSVWGEWPERPLSRT